MARFTGTSTHSDCPEWLSRIIGKKQDGVTITDISTVTAKIYDLRFRVTVKYDNNHREPIRFYSIGFNGNSWNCRTPNTPSICQDLLNWLNNTIQEPPKNTQ